MDEHGRNLKLWETAARVQEFSKPVLNVQVISEAQKAWDADLPRRAAAYSAGIANGLWAGKPSKWHAQQHPTTVMPRTAGEMLDAEARLAIREKSQRQMRADWMANMKEWKGNMWGNGPGGLPRSGPRDDKE